MNRRHKHKCFIPNCPNSVSKTQDKLFVSVHNVVKRKWCNQLNVVYNPQKRLYCCEDHLDLNKDLENYYQWKFMNAIPRLKPTARLRYSLKNNPSHAGIIPESEIVGVQMDTSNQSSELCKLLLLPIENIPSRTSENVYTSSACIEPEIKPEPMDDQYNDDQDSPEQDNDIDLEDIKIEVEEHPVASKLDENIPVFLPCTRKILPKINMFSIVEYIIENASYKDVDYKVLKTDIDINAEDTIGFVQLHKMADQVTLQATVAFDRVTAHVCVVKYDSFAQIIHYTNCECQQAACHHVLAFLLWLHRRSEEQLDNDMSFHLEPLVQQTTYLKAKDLHYDSDTDSVSDDLEIPENVEQIQRDIVHDFVRTCTELDMCNSPLYRYLNGNEQLEVSLHRMHCVWRDADTVRPPAPPAHFIHHCTKRMGERETTLQQLATCKDCEVLRELHYARLNGQQLYELCSNEAHSKHNMEIKEQIDALLNPDLQADDEFKETIRTTLEKQLNISISKCGIILNKEYPVYCSVPYGFTDTHVIDIVYYENEEQITDYMDGNALQPHIQFRLQFHMLLAEKEKAYLFIGFKKGNISKRIFIHELRFNEKYCKSFIKKGIEFWEENVFKMISK